MVSASPLASRLTGATGGPAWIRLRHDYLRAALRLCDDLAALDFQPSLPANGVASSVVDTN
jgi:hypothetical protein